MAAVSTLVGLLYLTLLHGFTFAEALPLCIAAGVIGAYVELITHRGYDTVTVPLANIAVLALLYMI